MNTTSPLKLHYVSCPQCSGAGTLRGDGARLQCPTCKGAGGWLETEEGIHLFYPVPPAISPRPESSVARWAWHAAAVGGAAVAVVSLGSLLVASWPALTRTFWQPHSSALVFGISGLLTMGAAAMIDRSQTSSRPLTDLSDTIAHLPAGAMHSLAPYSHQRLHELLHQAAAISLGYGKDSIEDIHVLLALLHHPRIRMMISRMEVSPEAIVRDLEQRLTAGNPKGGTATVSGPALQRMYQGVQVAILNNFSYVELEDVFLAYLPSQADQPSEYSAFFAPYGITYSSFYTVTRWYAQEQEHHRQWAFWQERGRVRPKGYMNRGWTALPTPYLDSFSTDLTLKASYGHVHTGTARAKELEEALTTLASHTIKNVLFVGEAGSDPESLLTAIATKIINEEVPEVLKDKRFISLDLANLLTSEGGAQANMQHVINEVSQASNVVLAIPEIKALADSTQAGLDGSSVLANALKNGSLQIVSTATYADFHRYVEQNSLLSGLLRVIELHSLTKEEVVQVLEEEAGELEHRFHVQLTYPALEEAAKLAERYMSDQAAPGGARHLIEVAAQQAENQKRNWIDHETVQHAVESITHIPVAQAEGAEAEKLLNLEQILHKRVVGQELAVKAVAEALRRARAGLSSGKRPLGSFLFVGPTGVGKTELAKALCESYFGPESSMIRFDMSEFQDPRAIYKLIGAPGENGASVEGGELTQAIREHPFGLILFDELEKAHPDVLNLFLQILDDGRVTENTGRTVSLTNCIIIATSNAGSSLISQLIKDGITLEQLTPQILQALEGQFKPEFLNRFDGLVPFQPLNDKELTQIAQIMITTIIDKAREQGITLQVTEPALAKLVQLGYNPSYGARPLRRTIEQKLEGILAKKLLTKEVGNGSTLQITPEMID